jgi:hypothetical protein
MRYEKLPEIIADWRMGRSVRLPSKLPVMLRCNLTPDDCLKVMETSKGVCVPIEDAERAFKFASKARAQGWHRNRAGEHCKVGACELDAVNEQCVIAGRHRVTWDEIERFAVEQGWTV